MRRPWFAVSAVAAGLIVGVGSSTAVAETSSSDADDRQEEQIEAKLESAPNLKNNDIDVDVDDGIAVLEGRVDSTQEKKEATKLAHVEGILGVNNRLEVRRPGK